MAVRIGPHSHPCGRCKQKVECCGEIVQNYDGWPEWRCIEYHDALRADPDDFLCDDCYERLNRVELGRQELG